MKYKHSVNYSGVQANFCSVTLKSVRKKPVEEKTCQWHSSLQIWSKSFFCPINFPRLAIEINVKYQKGLHLIVRYFYPILNRSQMCREILVEFPNTSSTKIRPVSVVLFHEERQAGRLVYGKLIGYFLQNQLLRLYLSFMSWLNATIGHNFAFYCVQINHFHLTCFSIFQPYPGAFFFSA
jgi:hypothetical protein